MFAFLNRTKDLEGLRLNWVTVAPTLCLIWYNKNARQVDQISDRNTDKEIQKVSNKGAAHLLGTST